MTLAVALPNWVGDAVMATPTMRALRARFPAERIVAVARTTVRQVLQPNPWIDAYIDISKEQAGFNRAAAALRKERAEVGILLPNSFRSALLFWMGRVKRRIGYDRGGRGMLLTDRLRPEREGGRFVPGPMITYYLRLAEVLGAQTEDPALRSTLRRAEQSRRMELFTTADDEAAAAAAFEALHLDPAKTLLLAPGYAFGPSKAWPAGHWAALARGARERFGLEPAILCGESEAPVAEAISEALGGCPAFHEKGITLASARAVVSRARAMVAIDSGLRHYAAAFAKPVVALFGPTDIRWTETWHSREVRLQAVVPCGPCQEPTCPTGSSECMYKIAPDEALDALAEAMKRDR
jgi:heptosyltransferase-2